MKSCLGKILLITISVLIAFGIAELAIRWMLFSGPDSMAGLRDPSRFSSRLSVDWWKLAYAWNTEGAVPPEHPHPYLGWTHSFHPCTYVHDEFAEVGDRRPVLLYGDSFSMCVEQADCFQDILNTDTSFAPHHYLLNYGVGGYGVGQISLLYGQTAHRYAKPFIVFGLLTSDLDRTVLPVRTGQKPYYIVRNDSLILEGYPILPSAAAWYEQHPVGGRSYAYSLFNYSPWNILPHFLNGAAKEEERLRAQIKEVNRRLLGEVAENLKASGEDFVFLVFHYERDMLERDNWRDAFLAHTLDSLGVPWISSKELVRADVGVGAFDYDQYLIKGEGHPTTYFNRLISEEIKRRVLPSTDTAALPAPVTSQHYSYTMQEWVEKIQANEKWKGQILEKAEQEGVDSTLQIRRDAVWMLKDAAKDECEAWFQSDSPAFVPGASSTSLRMPIK